MSSLARVVTATIATWCASTSSARQPGSCSRQWNPKGEFGYYIISEGGQKPYRIKIRSTSFSNLSILPWILEGQLIPDLVAVMGSLDFVLGDVDR